MAFRKNGLNTAGARASEKVDAKEQPLPSSGGGCLPCARLKNWWEQLPTIFKLALGVYVIRKVV